MLYTHVSLLMLRVIDVSTKTSIQQSARMLVAEIPGDVQIGALFSIHRQTQGSEGCGQIWEQYGIHRTEIALKTVQKLNENLPFRLGISIRDSCWTERIAMEQTIAFLREGSSFLSQGVAQCSCCQTPGCDKKSIPVVAIVGPAKSSGTIAVQNLLQVFRIPQIGYSATTPDLSDKDQFGYFMRVVPSDVWQARAIFNILVHYNWTYVVVFYSAGNYGEKGFEELEKIIGTSESAICIAQSEKVKSLADPSEFIKVLNATRNKTQAATVAVCFCEGQSMLELFRAQKYLRSVDPKFKPFQWIGSDGWADRKDVVEGVEEEATGSLSMRIHSPKVTNFEDHYFNLTPETNKNNPWFTEFWEHKFQCQFTIPNEKQNSGAKLCTGKENLRIGFEQDPKLSQVINAIEVVSKALHSMYSDNCRDNSTLCSEKLWRNGTLLYKYMTSVRYMDDYKQHVFFDENGDPPAWYDILNYVGKEGYIEVGRFENSGLTMNETTEVMYYNRGNVVPESVCSKPCGIGKRQRETSACCWLCDDCLDMQIVNYTNNQCQNCSIGYWPDANRTSCFALQHETLSWSTLGVILALVLAIVGIITTLFTVVVFLQHNSTPVVKSTTRELSYIILSGITACYAATFAILARPSFIMCFLTRTIPPIAFSIVYAALLTKTNRIARILAGSKKRILTKKPRFLSTFSQVVITWILVGIQCVIVAVGVMKEMPSDGFDPSFLPSRMVLVCQSSTVAFLTPFLWNLFLISLCTLYAVKTRNLPENFNEAKFIGFTMYCTIVVWSAFIVLHLGTMNKALTMSFSFSLSASIALVLLFFPKLYIIMLHPEKNVRASYTTTKLIRCHFGNSQGAYDSKHISSKTTRTSTQSTSSGMARTASVHVVSKLGNVDVATQTESGGKFARTFSIVGGSGGRKKTVDEDVQQLVEACRRYQDEKIHSAANLLLEEESEEEDVGTLLADSIENSMRTVLQTVAPRAAAVRTPRPSGVPGDDDGFEQPMPSTSYRTSSLSPTGSYTSSSASLDGFYPSKGDSPSPSPKRTIRSRVKCEVFGSTDDADDLSTDNTVVSDEELAHLTVKQLNHRLQGQDRELVCALKQKRRILKNRGYALNCRVKRIQNQLQLEADNLMLRDQVRYLRDMVHDLQCRLQYLDPSTVLAPTVPPMEVIPSSLTTPYPPASHPPYNHNYYSAHTQ